jgi:hypothetical protein
VGKGGQKVQVTEYYMSQHFGVCITVDAIKKIIIKEKKAWSGRVTDRSKELIQKDNLFGGATKEGGANGLRWASIRPTRWSRDQARTTTLSRRSQEAEEPARRSYRPTALTW